MNIEELARVALDAEQDRANPALNSLAKDFGIGEIEPMTWDRCPEAIRTVYLAIASAVALKVLEEAAKIAWDPKPDEIYAPCLAHGKDSCCAGCHRTASEMIHSLIGELK